MNDWRTREEAAIKIACIQMEPVIGEKERNVWRSLELIEDAAANGAHLLVLPELCNSGYVFDSARRSVRTCGGDSKWTDLPRLAGSSAKA